MRYTIRAFCWTLLLLGLSACTSPPVPQPVTLPTATLQPYLRLGLTSSAAPLAEQLTVAYANHNPDAILGFVMANTAVLQRDLAANELDAALLHYIPSDTVNWFNPVALDGVAVVVHPSNPINELTLAEVQGVFNGRINNWSALGGADAAINVISRERGAGTRTIWQQQVLAEQPLTIQAQILAPQTRLLEGVAADVSAIGYGMAGGMVDGVKVVGINGRWPTPNETGSQNYPLTTPLYFLMPTPDEPVGELRQFLAWLQSPNGQAEISVKYGRVR